jgi:SAM-dependent methyltransferase/uncharacterized protein YbaR (Trm112 family)
MNERLLDILECPFCGDRVGLQESPAPEVRAGEIVNGILQCQCCAYPVIGGIPVLRMCPEADAAMELLGAGRTRDALRAMLGLSEAERAERFDALLSNAAKPPTFRAAVEVLSRDAEGVYLLYRFSDPTFLCARAVLEAAFSGRPPEAGRVLDVGGGAGHLAYAVGRLAPAAAVVVADLEYWKLWLARRFVASRCEAVCCDAAVPLPFARAAFDVTYCSDALHYVWPRRLLAGEMSRATRAGGATVLAHLHNALCENESPGMPLTPAGYRHLFEERQPAMYRERDVLGAVVGGRPFELGAGCSDAELADEPALMLTAGVAARVHIAPPRRTPQNLHLNPLYAPVNGSRTVRLQFPSDFYAEEFAACRRYLPDVAELPERWADGGEQVAQLIEQRVLLELPENYL